MLSVYWHVDKKHFILMVGCRMLRYGSTHALAWPQSSSSVVPELFSVTGLRFSRTHRPQPLPEWPCPLCSLWWHRIHCRTRGVQPYKSSTQYLKVPHHSLQLRMIKLLPQLMHSRHSLRHLGALLQKSTVGCYWH